LRSTLPNPRSHHFVAIVYCVNVHSMVDPPTGLWQVSQDEDIYPGVHPGTELTERRHPRGTGPHQEVSRRLSHLVMFTATRLH